MQDMPTCCFKCDNFRINPPIIEEPYRCALGAKEMPTFEERESRVANDCPIWARITKNHLKEGRWIAVENDIDYYPFMCSECYETVTKKTKFCPNCGARMDATKGTKI